MFFFFCRCVQLICMKRMFFWTTDVSIFNQITNIRLWKATYFWVWFFFFPEVCHCKQQPTNQPVVSSNNLCMSLSTERSFSESALLLSGVSLCSTNSCENQRMVEDYWCEEFWSKTFCIFVSLTFLHIPGVKGFCGLSWPCIKGAFSFNLKKKKKNLIKVCLFQLSGTSQAFLNCSHADASVRILFQ